MADAARHDVDPETLSMIRGMLAEEETQARIDAKPASNRFSEINDPSAPEFVERRAAPQPHLEPYLDGPRRSRFRLPSFGGWRPSRRLLICAALLVLLLVRPVWVLGTVLLMCFVTLGMFLLFGADRVWGGFVIGLRHYVGRHPDRGPRIVARLDRFADRWDRVLDLFPEGLVDGLYFPDLQSLMEADDRHAAAVSDRLDRLREQA
ncbi:MAG: hypothetical protein AAGM84_15495 [Pseudomonadota bacterium]